MLFLSRASRISQLLKPHTVKTSGISMLFQVFSLSSRPHAITAVKTSGLFQNWGCMRTSHGASHLLYYNIHYCTTTSGDEDDYDVYGSVCKGSGVIVSCFPNHKDVDLTLDYSSALDPFDNIKIWLDVRDFETNHLLGMLEIQGWAILSNENKYLVHCLKLKGCMDLKVGQVVELEQREGVPVGRGLLGRVINPLGDPLDWQGDIKSEQLISIYRDPPPVLVKSAEEVLFTGIKLIDLLTPIRRGGNFGLYGDKKAVNDLTYELINNFKRVYGVAVYAGEGGDLKNNDLYLGMIKNGIMLCGDKQADGKCVMVYSPSSEFNEASGACDLVDLTAFTLAEHFCRVEMQDVLLFQDTVGQRVKWIFDKSSGAVHIPNAITSPKPVTCISICRNRYNKTLYPLLDGGINLFVEDGTSGIFPTIDLVTSRSRILSKKYVGDEHFRIANRVKNLLARYKKWQLLPEGKSKNRVLKNNKTSMTRARKVMNFLTQPRGKFVNQDDCVQGFAGILNGDFDHIPDEDFLMIGKVDEIRF